MATRDVLFATCAPGVEPVLHAEAKALRLPRVERQVGGVRFEGGALELWRANLELRTAVRVLRRLARFPAPDADALYAGVRALPWEDWLAPGATVVVDAQARESGLDHTLFVAQRTKDALVDRLRAARGERPDVDREDADLRVHVHLWRDRATVSLDASGPSLHRRGWRVHQGRAPLAETLAAAVVHLSDWDGRAPFVDPFCGSGTLLVEAAHRAMDRAPGLGRSFAFERWPEHDARAYERLLAAVRARVHTPRRLQLVGADVDPARVEETAANLAAAGVEGVATLAVEDARSLPLRRGWNGWIVSNLPYGVRVGGEDQAELVEVVRGFGAHLRAVAAGYEVALLSGDPRLSKALALKADRRHALQNGALAVELLRCSIRERA